MRRRPYVVNDAADESASVLTTALVLAMFGVLSGIEARSWIMTSTLFILAAVAGVAGLVLRYGKKN